jgi:hypothetical protein
MANGHVQARRFLVNKQSIENRWPSQQEVIEASFCVPNENHDIASDIRSVAVLNEETWRRLEAAAALEESHRKLALNVKSDVATREAEE